MPTPTHGRLVVLDCHGTMLGDGFYGLGLLVRDEHGFSEYIGTTGSPRSRPETMLRRLAGLIARRRRKRPPYRLSAKGGSFMPPGHSVIRGERKSGHVCTQFEEVTVDGTGPCLYRTCKTCGQDWQRGDTRTKGE